ncbi:MAG: PAS domain-containing protein [Planctomycetota bacterium]|nr:MAG: PAS domain-containing protein [Planctomycetota bacterium]
MEVALLAAGAALLGAGAGGILLRARRRRRALEARAEFLEVGLRQLQRAAEYLHEGLLLLSAEDRVVYANPAAMDLLGVKNAPEPGAEPRLEYFVGSDDLAARLRVETAEQSVRRVVEVEGRSGEQVLEVTAAPVPGGRLVLLRDLRALEAVDRKRRDFVANASHELQTPIAAIIGLLDLIETLPEAERGRLLERARRNAEALSSLTRDLLGLARAEDPEWRPAPKPTRLQEVVARVVDVHAPRAQHKGLVLQSQVEPPELELVVDPMALQTVLGNLVDNAVNYTESGIVQVSVGTEAGLGAVLEVADTGHGIAPEVQPRIFERFFRGDPARSRETGGTGLGLSIVRNLLRRMGGRIALASRPGVGSRFRVELPESPARPLPGAGQAEFK